MPCTSAVRACGSMAMTPPRPDTSSPGTELSLRGRKRFEVFLANRTGAPRGIAAWDRTRRSTASRCALQPAIGCITQTTLVVTDADVAAALAPVSASAGEYRGSGTG